MGVRCRTCETWIVDEEEQLPATGKQVEFKSPEWKKKLKWPQCKTEHEYDSRHLEMGLKKPKRR